MNILQTNIIYNHQHSLYRQILYLDCKSSHSNRLNAHWLVYVTKTMTRLINVTKTMIILVNNHPLPHHHSKLYHNHHKWLICNRYKEIIIYKIGNINKL